MYWLSVWGAILAPLVGAYVFGPFFFKLKVVSVFEVSQCFTEPLCLLLGVIHKKIVVIIIRTHCILPQTHTI